MANAVLEQTKMTPVQADKHKDKTKNNMPLPFNLEGTLHPEQSDTKFCSNLCHHDTVPVLPHAMPDRPPVWIPPDSALCPHSTAAVNVML